MIVLLLLSWVAFPVFFSVSKISGHFFFCFRNNQEENALKKMFLSKKKNAGFSVDVKIKIKKTDLFCPREFSKKKKNLTNDDPVDE